jgi:hypothetical protein
MDEILDHLPQQAWVLDLGSKDGSFPGPVRLTPVTPPAFPVTLP